jgi:MATE family multidrug resistance protein
MAFWPTGAPGASRAKRRGNHVLFGFIAVIAQILDGVTQATESLTGAAVGAKDRADLRRIAGATTLWSAAMALGLSTLLHQAGPFLLPLFTSDARTLAAGAQALPWLAWSPLVSVWCFQLDGIFLGATRSTEMRNGMAAAAAGALGVSWLAIPALSNDGLCLAVRLLSAACVAAGAWYPHRAVDPKLPEPGP